VNATKEFPQKLIIDTPKRTEGLKSHYNAKSYFSIRSEILFSRCKSQQLCYTSRAMADNDQLLKAIESIKSDVGNIKKDMATKADVHRVEQTQTAQGSSIAQNTTLLEAVAAGQNELKEIVATKADVLSVEVKVDKLRKRIEGIEEHTGSSTHKN